MIEISAKLDEGREELQRPQRSFWALADMTLTARFCKRTSNSLCRTCKKYLAMALESLDMGETLDAVTVMIDNGANALLELTGEKLQKRW